MDGHWPYHAQSANLPAGTVTSLAYSISPSLSSTSQSPPLGPPHPACYPEDMEYFTNSTNPTGSDPVDDRPFQARRSQSKQCAKIHRPPYRSRQRKIPRQRFAPWFDRPGRRPARRRSGRLPAPAHQVPDPGRTPRDRGAPTRQGGQDPENARLRTTQATARALQSRREWLRFFTR